MSNGEYSNLAFSKTLGLCPKSSTVKYWYFSKRSLDEKPEILAPSLLKSYWTWFTLILSSRILSSSVNVFSYKDIKRFFLNLRGSLAGNVVSIVKKIRFSCAFSVNPHKIVIINICRMINCNIL